VCSLYYFLISRLSGRACPEFQCNNPAVVSGLARARFGRLRTFFSRRGMEMLPFDLKSGRLTGSSESLRDNSGNTALEESRETVSGSAF